MPSLQNQAMEARKHLKAARDDAAKRRTNGSRQRPRVLRMERDIAALWGLCHGWSDGEISDYFYISRTATARARRDLNDSPSTTFALRSCTATSLATSRSGAVRRVAGSSSPTPFSLESPSRETC